MSRSRLEANSEATVSENKDSATESPTISAEEYRRMLGGLSLVNVALANCEAKADPGAAALVKAGPVPVRISETASFEQREGEVAIRHNYRVTAVNKRRRIFTLKADFAVTMEVREGFSEQFFDAFKNVTLRLITWPYLRELVGSMTQRMDLPKLQLGLWRVPFA
jgi:hypothetical protein